MKTLSDLLDSFANRVPWDTAKKILKDKDLPRGRGWSATRAKLEEALKGDEHTEAVLRDALVEHMLSGEKCVSFYQLKSEAAALLRNRLLETRVEKTPFPYLLSKSEIDRAPLSKPRLVAIETIGSDIAAVFSSVRMVEIQETIEIEKLSKAEAGKLADYSEVVGVRREKKQTFDVMWLPLSGDRMELRIDAPKGLPHEMAHVARQQLTSAVENSFSLTLPTPVNMFPLVKKLYDDPSEGQVVELTFHTTTASLKHERMRRRKSCLRKEIYHMAGKQALNGKISAYRLSVQWPRDRGKKNVSIPELSINGTIHMLHETHPFLGDVTLRGCMDTDDYNFVQQRILHHL